MASRLARTAIGKSNLPQLELLRLNRLTTTPPGAARLRPTLPARTLPSLAITAVRNASYVPPEDPKSKAQSIIDSLPGNSLISKTAILSSAAGLSVYAISNEYYVGGGGAGGAGGRI